MSITDETLAFQAADHSLPDAPENEMDDSNNNNVPPLTMLYLYIAGSCNLACRHCWITPTYDPHGKSTQFIKLAYVEKAIRDGKPLGLRSVKLTGGEPLLHPQFRELLALIHGEGMTSIIETNGTLLDDDLAVFLNEHGVTFVSVSLDGAKPETHDYMRAVPGSYQRAVNGIRALVGAGYHPQVICTVHQGNMGEMADLVALAESWGCGSVKFNNIQRVGRGERMAADMGLDVPELIRLYQYVEQELVPRASIPIHFDIPVAFQRLGRLINNENRCAIQNILGILSSGEISMCGIGVTTPELIYGHLERDNLAQIWYKNKELALLRGLIPGQLGGICGQCIHHLHCQGHCVAHTYYATKKLNAPHRFCDRAAELGLFPAARLTIDSAQLTRHS